MLNKLSGTIPSEIGLLSNTLSNRCFSGNMFTGTLPSELGMLTLAKGFPLHENLFTGTIPTGKYFAEAVEVFLEQMV